MTLFPVAGSYSAASGTFTALWGGGTQIFAGSGQGPIPAPWPSILASGVGYCIAPGGTTINAKAITYYRQSVL